MSYKKIPEVLCGEFIHFFVTNDFGLSQHVYLSVSSDSLHNRTCCERFSSVKESLEVSSGHSKLDVKSSGLNSS